MITTYLHPHEFKSYSSVKDKDLNELFQEVRSKFGDNYFLQEIEVTKERLFRVPITTTYYCLYARRRGNIPNDSEVQIINFARDHEYSISTDVPKSYIMTYFYGMLTGAALVEVVKQ